MAAKGQCWYRVRALANGVGELRIFSDIGGWDVNAQTMLRDIRGLGDIGTLRIRINSNGGDVIEGFTIFNMLSAMKDVRKEVIIDGLAASMASVIAMVGDSIEMPKNAMMMIHNPWGMAAGGADEIKSFGEALAIMRDNIIQTYADRTLMSPKKIGAMMDKETWLSAQQAVDKGFATAVVEPIAMAAQVNVSKFKNVPATFKGESAMTEKTAKQELFEDDDADTAGGEKPAEVTAESVRAEVVKVAKDIRAMVKLAGKPAEMADKFISDGLSVADVLAKLQEEPKDKGSKGKAKAESDDVNPRRGNEEKSSPTLDVPGIWDRFNSFADVRAKRDRARGRRAA